MLIARQNFLPLLGEEIKSLDLDRIFLPPLGEVPHEVRGWGQQAVDFL